MSSRSASGAPARPFTPSPDPTTEPAFDLVESKLRPPPSLAGGVERTALLEDLERPRPEPVVLVSAAAGYGKTTLLSQWASRSVRDFAWVTLDQHDNDPVVLLTYIATALERQSLLSPEVVRALSTPGASVEAVVVPRLTAAMASISSDFVIVLDDIHELSDPRCVDAIDALVESLPDGPQLVLSGRFQPSKRIGSLRARGLTFEIGPSALRMGQAEARELFDASDVNLGESKVAELVHRTEGWPAGLYLGALSIRGGAPVGADGSLRGDHRFVADYLREQLLSGIPADELQFLTRTSVLDLLSAPVCDAVLEAPGSGPMLESLERHNLFVVPLDQNRKLFRYHHLFRELLRTELERAEPQLVPELLGRASDWSAEEGQSDAAVAYAQAAGDAGRVSNLVLARGQLEYRQGRAATVELWLDWLEEDGRLDQRPMVAALGAWFSAIQGNNDRTERWTDLAEQGVDGVSGPERVQIDGWLALLRAVRSRGGVAGMLEDTELAMNSFPRAGEWWLTGALIHGIACLVAGEDSAADDLLESVVESGLATEAWAGASVALAERAAVAIGRGDWDSAETFAEQAESIVRSSRMEEYPPNSIVFAVAARIAVHRREAERASEMLTRAQRLRTRLTHVTAMLAIQVRLVLAQAYAALPDPAGARTQLREAGGLMSRGAGFGVFETQAEEVRLMLESARSQAPGASSLTTAELRLLPLLPTHLSFREIGERLYLSRHTVKSQAMSIYRKLDVTSRTEAVARARDLGLI